jgi:PP-loop superfamily ATP-utilizing enzyme
VELGEEEMKGWASASSARVSTVRADRLAADLQTMGYKYVALDPEGYRQGSLNEVLPSDGT